MVINDLRGKKIEVILTTCIMVAAPVLFFFLLSSLSIFLTIAVIEIFCIAFLGIRKRARNQLKKEKSIKTTKIPFYNSESPHTIQPVNYVEKNGEHNANIKLQVPELMNDESLFIIDTFNELEFYELVLDLKGKEETVMLLTKNPNSFPEWICGIMAFKIEKFTHTQTHTQESIIALLDHLVGKTFSISYVTDMDHAYIRVIKERPITSTFPAAANVLIAELLEDFLLVYDAFITEFPGCEIKQLANSALISHLFGALVDFESRTEIIEFTAKKKEIETELEYNKVELNSVRAFFLPKQLRNRYSTIARTNDLYYYDMTEGDLDVAPFLAATMALQFQNYTTAIILAVSLFVIGIIIKYLRSRNAPTAVIKLKKMFPVVDKVFINGNYAFVQKKGNVFHAIAVHQIGEGIPRTGNNTSTYSQESPVTKSDGLQKLFRTLTKNRSNLKAFIHAKGRVANTNIELVDEEVLDGRRILYNPEPYYQITPYFVVTQPFVYDGQEKFSEFLSRFDEANQQLKISIKNAFPTLKLIPTTPKKVALSFEYILSQLYSAYSIETVQLDQSEKDSAVKVGVFKRPLEANSSFLSKKQSQGFFEVVSGVAKRYQPAQFAIPAKSENTIFVGYAVDTISDTVTTREVGFDLQHLQTNIGVYGLDRITTVRRIIHELCKRQYSVILIDPQYSERAQRKEPNYYDLPAHSLKLGVDFSFNPLDRMGGSTGDFIDGFLTILQMIFGKGDLSRWQFVTKKLKELYETKEKEGEPTLVELLEDLEFSEDEEFVEFATPALEELKDVLERILSDRQRIAAIGASTTHPFHMLFSTQGLTVIDLSTFSDRNFLSFLLQLLIHSIHTFKRYNPAGYQNTVLIIENADMLFPVASYLVSYRYRSRVEKFHPLESLRNTALIVSLESPSETPYLFDIPRTKIIGRVTRAADIQLVRDTLGLTERSFDSRKPHPLQETYFRTMKVNHALLYLQRKGEEAQYVPLKVKEVQMYSSPIDTDDEQRNESLSTPPILRNGQLKYTVLEKDFDTDIELYYNILYALREMGDRGTPYSALPEMLPDIDEKQLAKATINLIKKRYVFRKEHTSRDSYKPLTTIRISPKGIEALEEYEMKKAMKIQQSIDADEVLTDSNEIPNEIVEIDHPESPKVSLIDSDSRIENYRKSIEEKTSLNDARDLLKQANELRNNYPQAATSSIVFCYDAIKVALLKLLEIDTDAKIELDQIVSALISCGIVLPVDYSGLQNVIQKHKLAITQGIVLEQVDIGAIIGDSELIVAELEKFKLSVRDRIRVIKTILSGEGEINELREEREVEDWNEEKIDTADPFVDKTFPPRFVMGTVTEEEIGLHSDLKMNGLLKDIWDVVGREGGLKSVIKNQLILRRYDGLGIERAINVMINRGLLCENEKGFLERCDIH